MSTPSRLSLLGPAPNPTPHTPPPLYRYTKLSKLNADRSKEISKLQGQISEMKHAKVAIQRKASEESSQYRDWRQARMREISQLRREARVSKLEHHRLLSAHAKQEAILKRRTEEVAAVQRRLREQAKSGRGTARGGRTDAARDPPSTPGGGGGGIGAASGGATSTAAVEKTIEGELSRRLRERTRGVELERTAQQRAELAARRDAARERKALLESEGNDAEAREIDDEIESLEAQLEVKAARIEHEAGGAGREGGGGGGAFADVEARALAERLFEKLVEGRLRTQEFGGRLEALRLERDALSEALGAAQLEAQQTSQRHEQALDQSRRAHESRLQAVIESRTEDADDAAAPAAAAGTTSPATITAAPAAAPAAETPGADDAPPTISKPIAELSAATRDLLKSMGMTPGAARVCASRGNELPIGLSSTRAAPATSSSGKRARRRSRTRRSTRSASRRRASRRGRSSGRPTPVMVPRTSSLASPTLTSSPGCTAPRATPRSSALWAPRSAAGTRR